MSTWLPSAVWLVLLVLFGVAEAATVGLVSIWFAAGALAGLLSAFFLENIWTQIAIFLAVSALTLALVRPLVGKYLTPRQIRTNADRVLGQEAVVTQAIDGLNATGAVKVGGVEWSARSEAGPPIPSGQVVTVLRIDGVKLIVSPALERKE